MEKVQNPKPCHPNSFTSAIGSSQRSRTPEPHPFRKSPSPQLSVGHGDGIDIAFLSQLHYNDNMQQPWFQIRVSNGYMQGDHQQFMEYCGAEKLATASEFADLVKDKYVLRDHNSTFYVDGRANFLRTLSPEFVSQKSNVQHQVNNYQIVDSTGYIPGGYKYNQKLNLALNGNLGKLYCAQS